jgi:hypothetical protein
MPQLETIEFPLTQRPDRLIMWVPGLSGARARRIANESVRQARQLAPKLSGRMASRMFPVYGKNYFGVGWLDSTTWFQEHGIRAFTMTSLAGKIVPMWIDDPYGTLMMENPKSPTRVTLSGRPQVLIFRRAAKMGERRTVRRKTGGSYVTSMVPKSYPGAPGRIGVRETRQPWTTPGRTPGAVARGNIGVRWRHPGLQPRAFINHAMTMSAQRAGILPIRIYIADPSWRSRFPRN